MSKQKNEQAEGSNSFTQFFTQAEEQTDYWVELAKLEFTEEMISRMKELAVSKSQLAKNLGIQPGLVTRLVSGRNNFTLSTMVRVARALDCEFRSHLQPTGTNTCWINVLTSDAEPAPACDWDPKQFTKVDFNAKAISYEPVPSAA